MPTEFITQFNIKLLRKQNVVLNKNVSQTKIVFIITYVNLYIGIFLKGNWYLFLSFPHFLGATSRQRPRIVTSSGQTLFLLNLSCCSPKGLKSPQYHSFCQLSILFYYRLLNHGSSNFLWLFCGLVRKPQVKKKVVQLYLAAKIIV